MGGVIQGPRRLRLVTAPETREPFTGDAED